MAIKDPSASGNPIAFSEKQYKAARQEMRDGRSLGSVLSDEGGTTSRACGVKCAWARQVI